MVSKKKVQKYQVKQEEELTTVLKYSYGYR